MTYGLSDKNAKKSRFGERGARRRIKASAALALCLSALVGCATVGSKKTETVPREAAEYGLAVKPLAALGEPMRAFLYEFARAAESADWNYIASLAEPSYERRTREAYKLELREYLSYLIRFGDSPFEPPPKTFLLTKPINITFTGYSERGPALDVSGVMVYSDNHFERFTLSILTSFDPYVVTGMEY